MKRLLRIVFILTIMFMVVCLSQSKEQFERDTFKTSKGDLKIYFIGHGTLMFEFNKTIIHVDPWSTLADYSKLPKADIILITHNHQDHFDASAITLIAKKETQIISTAVVCENLEKGIVMNNWDKKIFEGIEIEAVPAYNNSESNTKFHPKGRDNGYVLTIGGKRIYIAGDTENIQEIDSLKAIDIVFLPMNQPYTMLPVQVIDVVNRMLPKIVYPYHYGDSNLSELQKLMSKYRKIELRIRKMK